MKNILFLGDYFPHLSMDSLRNYIMTKRLFLEGFNIFLLSDAWNKADEHSFIKYMPNESEHLAESFYVDPVQVRYSNTTIALIALAKLICFHNEIDYVYVSGVQEYGVVAENLASNFDIPIITAFYADHSAYAMYESYTKTWFEGYIRKSKYLLAHRHQLSLYEKYKDQIVIDDVFPYTYPCKKKTELNRNVVIIGRLREMVNVAYLARRINEIAGEADIKLLIEYDRWDKINEMLKDNDKMQLVAMDNGIGALEDLSASVAFSTEYLLDSNDVMVDDALLLLSLGLYPAVNKRTHGVLQMHFSPSFFNYDEETLVLNSISANEEHNTYHSMMGD